MKRAEQSLFPRCLIFAERDRVCNSLYEKDLVEYESGIAKFAITLPGKTLLGLHTTSLPVTPDELALLKACKGVMRPEQLGNKIPVSDRQTLIANLVARRMIKVTKVTIRTVWLSTRGQKFLREEYEPNGKTLVATGEMLGNYVKFLRLNTSYLADDS